MALGGGAKRFKPNYSLTRKIYAAEVLQTVDARPHMVVGKQFPPSQEPICKLKKILLELQGKE